MKALALAALLLAGCAVSTSPDEQGAAAQADTVPELQPFGAACRATPDDLNACVAGLTCFGATEYGAGARVCTFECLQGGDARCKALGGTCAHAWDTCVRPDPSVECAPPTLVQHSLCVLP